MSVTASTGSSSTSISSIASAASASVSATAIATGCPAYMISSRARGVFERPGPVATIGRSAAVSTATTPGSSLAAVVSTDLISAWASCASSNRACSSPLTGTSAA